jgi:SAM-dependent methyltransferase
VTAARGRVTEKENRVQSPEQKTAEALWPILGAKFLTKSLYVAARLKVADALAEGPLHLDELAQRVGAHAPSLYRLLRALASAGIFAEGPHSVFENTPMSELIIDSPHSLRPMLVWINDPRHDHLYESLLHCVQTGETAVSKVTGKPVWEWLQSQPDLHAIFNRAMTSNAANLHRAAVEAYDYGSIGTLVDVGGGHGQLLLDILKAHPGVRGVVFDQPALADGARDNIATQGLNERCRVESGDFFKEVPAGDAHLMSFIVHDWHDEPAAAILRNIHRAQPANGRVILVENVIPDGNEMSFGKLIDIEMLALANGRERRAEEFAALFASAGYRLSRIVPTASPSSVVEAVKG